MPLRRWTSVRPPACARAAWRRGSTAAHPAAGCAGSATRLRASATRCCCPPHSSLGARARAPPGSTHASAARPGFDLGPGDAPELQAEGDVLVHALVRPHRIALEHHPHVAPLGWHHAGRRGERDRADPDGALVGRHEPGDQAEERRLAAAARAQQRHELVVLDVQAQSARTATVSPNRLVTPLDGNRRHQAAGQPITAPRQRPQPGGSSPRRGQG